MKKAILGLMALATSTAFAGETPYAKVVALSGNVTVASKSQMTPAKVGMPLAQGASVLPGSNAKARTVQGSAGSLATGGEAGLMGLPTVTIVAGGIVVAGVFYEVAIKDDNNNTPGGGGGTPGGTPGNPANPVTPTPNRPNPPLSGQ